MRENVLREGIRAKSGSSLPGVVAAEKMPAFVQIVQKIYIIKNLEKRRKKLLTFIFDCYIMLLVNARAVDREHIGVWLSLARALDLGSRGRRFESCHPDTCGCSSMVEH